MRRVPYTERGLSRVQCTRCGGRSVAQWGAKACAAGGETGYYGLCAACDVALNAMLLRFLGVEGAEGLVERYREMVERAG